jgi:hypothetical protein
VSVDSVDDEPIVRDSRREHRHFEDAQLAVDRGDIGDVRATTVSVRRREVFSTRAGSTAVAPHRVPRPNDARRDPSERSERRFIATATI